MKNTKDQLPLSTNDHPSPLVPGYAALTTIFCDGACAGNPGPGGWGCIVEQGKERRELSGGHPQTTNNQMELQALIEGLHSVPVGTRVRIVTDSEYVAKGITSWLKGWMRNGWKTASKQPVKNKERWQEIQMLLNDRPHEVEWVRGHNGHPENERCDELARAAISSVRSR
jgi:ribonuclease HI